MTVVDQSAWWNPLLTSAIFDLVGGTATYVTVNQFFINIYLKIVVSSEFDSISSLFEIKNIGK